MAHSMEYYLSKGFDEKAARYFSGGRKKAVSVTACDDFTLAITFEGDEVRVFDVKPLIKRGTVFEPLIERDSFKRVYIDSNGCVAWDIDPTVDSEVDWSNKIDISADVCYMDSEPAA